MAENNKLSAKARRWESPKNLEKLTEWASKGLTLKDIAEKIGISRTTLGKWRSNSPLITEAIEQGFEGADDVIEGALFRKAHGFEYPEITEIYDRDGELVERKMTTKIALPDSRAMIFWLKNRRGEDWNKENAPVDIQIKADDGFFKALTSTAKSDWEGAGEDED